MRLMLALVAMLVSATASARPTVGVAPFVSEGADHGYRWIGSALARSLAARIHHHSELNSLTVRQVNAALRSEGLAPADIQKLEVATAVGRQLGADLLVVGGYKIENPNVVLEVALVNPQRGERIHQETLRLRFDALGHADDTIAKLIAEHLKLGEFPPSQSATHSGSEAAWASTSMAMGILDRQSLSPAAAEVDVPLQISAYELGQAVEHLKAAIASDPESAEAWVGMAITSALVHETLAAEKALTRANELGGSRIPSAVLARSYVLMRNGRSGSAAGVLSEAIHIDGGFLHALGTLGELFVHIGHYKSAVVMFTRYAQIAPRNPWVLVQRGIARSKQGDHKGAIADTRAALTLVPDSVSVHRALVQRHLDAGATQDAANALTEAIEKHPADSSLQSLLARVRGSGPTD